jgi:hypothetical protein
MNKSIPSKKNKIDRKKRLLSITKNSPFIRLCREAVLLVQNSRNIRFHKYILITTKYKKQTYFFTIIDDECFRKMQTL